MYKLENYAESTLAAGINDSVTELSVDSGDGALFPAEGDFMLAIDNKEIVKATARSTDAITIVRAQEDTSAVAHLAGVSVALVVTAGVIEEVQDAVPDSIFTTRGDILYRDATQAARLAKGTAGHFLEMGANDPAWASHKDLTTGVHGAGGNTFGYATQAAITLYVDAANGDDDDAGTSGSPKATIKGALDALPPIIAHACTISVRGQQNYAENNVALEFSRFSTLADITIKAVNAANENMYDNGLATAGANTTLTDAGKDWTPANGGGSGQFAGAYIWIYEGLGVGQIRTIASNTATVITVSAAWTTNPDATSYYAIGGGATMTGTGTHHVYIEGRSVSVYGLRHTGATTADIAYIGYAGGSAYYNYCHGSVVGIWAQAFSDPVAYYNYCDATGAGTRYGMRCVQTSVWPRRNVLINGAYGISLERVALGQMHSAAAQKNYISDCTTGIRIAEGSAGILANSQVFNNCTADIDPAVSATVPNWWT